MLSIACPLVGFVELFVQDSTSDVGPLLRVLRPGTTCDGWRQVQHGAHRHGPATTLANTAHGQHQSAVHIGLLFCKWKWVSANIFDNKSNCSIQYNSQNTTSARYITVCTIVLYMFVLYWQYLVLLYYQPPPSLQTSNIITIICGIWRTNDVIFLKITSPCHLTVWLNVITLFFVIT